MPGSEPPALLKVLAKLRASWIDEFDAREQESEEHKQYVEARKVQEEARKQCPGVITQFAPTRFGRLDYSGQARVQAALQAYLDKAEAMHQEDLQKFEADKTFTAWCVLWTSVLEKMRKYADQSYDVIEGRTKESERL